ncbi:FA57B protein, partial [Chordeiles acutipennis]|nr:FA57B protein [Chordeiles acutipennis]
RHWLAGVYPEFAVPYFIYDVYAMFLCHRQRALVKGHQLAPPPSLRASLGTYLRKDLMMVLHHVAMVFACYPVTAFWREGKGDFFLGCLLMAELSTPFVCLGKVLILFHLQHTTLHKLNAVVLLVTFFFCRLLLFPYLYWAYGRQRGLSLLAVVPALPLTHNMAAAALLAPQIYWFVLIARGTWRLFSSSPRPRQPP